MNKETSASNVEQDNILDTDSSHLRHDRRPHIENMDTTGVRDGRVGTANTASSVDGGMGNTTTGDIATNAEKSIGPNIVHGDQNVFGNLNMHPSCNSETTPGQNDKSSVTVDPGTMADRHKEVIQNKWTWLLENVILNAGLTDHLFQSKVLNQIMLDRIAAQPIPWDQNKEFFRILLKKGPESFDKFIDALKKTDQEYIANELLEDLKLLTRK